MISCTSCTTSATNLPCGKRGFSARLYSPHRPPHALHALYKRPRGTSHEFAISKLRAPSTEPLPSTPKEGLLRDWREVAENLEMTRSMFPIRKRFSVESSQSSTNSRLLSLPLPLLIITIYGLLLVSTCPAAEGRYLPPPVVTKSIVAKELKGEEGERDSQPS